MDPTEFNGSESLENSTLPKTTKNVKKSNRNDICFDIDSPYNNLFFHNFEQILIEHIKNHPVETEA